MTAVLAGGVLALGGCGGSVDSSCKSICDKQYDCGDIDSVQADQCRNKCDGDAAQQQSELDKCANEGDILSAVDQCVGRACSDYSKCLSTLPACQAGGTISGGNGGGLPSGTTSCDQQSGGLHFCAEVSATEQCPQGSNKVSECSTANVLGICTITSGSVTDREFFYSGGGLTVSEAEMACQSSHGTWSG